DEKDPLARVRERSCEGQADVAGAHDGDVALHRPGIVATSTCAIRSEACPSPYKTGRLAGIDADATAAASAPGSAATSTFAPTATVSTHSVDGRTVTQGTPYQ